MVFMGILQAGVDASNAACPWHEQATEGPSPARIGCQLGPRRSGFLLAAASARCRKPIVPEPIESYGFISDMHGAGLVSRGGSLDWL
jgi:hypothetical protein